jgi:thymidylate synthase
MNNLDKQYTDLLQDILDNRVTKSDRTGTGTKSLFGKQIRHKMSDGFPLLTTKKMPFKTIVTELLWFLRGDTNIKYLVDNGCNIWNGDAYKRYANSHNTFIDGFTHVTPMAHSKESFIGAIKTDDEFAKKWGELGPIYGKQWRKWADYYNGSAEYTDQISNLINDLKTNPDSRRLMVSAWNVSELDEMVLTPCHYGFQVYTRELSFQERLDIYDPQKLYHNEVDSWFLDKLNIPTRAISLMWNQRSVDTFLGLPFNIASYGLLLEIIAKTVNMVPDELIGNLGDTHLYSNHIEQAKEQIGRELDLEERRKMVTQEMFNQIYNGGGPESLSHSEIDQWNIPRTELREPFPLPTLKINSGNENWHLLTIDEIINSLDVDITFKTENYQSHPSIKAPLSN